MRTLLSLFLIALLAAPAAYGQTDTADFYAASRYLSYTPHVVETEATALAETHQYLDTMAPAGDPTALVAGDLLLRIDGHPFTLHIRPSDPFTEVKLESRQFNITPAVKEKAEAFLQQLKERLS